MDHSGQVESAKAFRAMHQKGRVLLLPNVWDAGSARLFATRGFEALATTSGGVAWSLGYADGERAPLDEVLEAVRRITRAAGVPVTVDFESGYGRTPEEVADSVRAVIAAGAIGINLEDGIAHTSLRGVDEAAARIAAARRATEDAGVPIFINARVDTWIIGGSMDDETRFQETLLRARAYLAAGADGIYPIALAKPDVIARLCEEIPAPVNIGARPGLPSLEGLARLGVARVSTATRLALAAYGAAEAAAAGLRETGRFDPLAVAFGYDDMQRLFT